MGFEGFTMWSIMIWGAIYEIQEDLLSLLLIGYLVTIWDPGKGGNEVILTDDGESYEHVCGQQYVEDEATSGPGILGWRRTKC